MFKLLDYLMGPSGFCVHETLYPNNKVLYDFYDIECYDPDDRYFGDQYVNDDCSYTGGD